MVAGRLDCGDGSVLAHLGSRVERRREKGCVRAVGERGAAVGLEEGGLAGVERKRPAAVCLGAVDELVIDPAGSKRLGVH